jgi:CdiI immunity protein
MSGNMKNLEMLEQVLGCYFHQDFEEEYGNIHAAIQDIIRGHDINDLFILCDQINYILEHLENEENLKEFLISNYQIQVNPKVGGDNINTYTELLEYIKNKIEIHLESKGVKIK